MTPNKSIQSAREEWAAVARAVAEFEPVALVTTEQCLLHPGPDPGVSKEE